MVSSTNMLLKGKKSPSGLKSLKVNYKIYSLKFRKKSVHFKQKKNLACLPVYFDILHNLDSQISVYKADNCFKFVKENTQMYELSYFKKKIRLKFDQIKLEVSYRISKVRNRSKYVSMQIHPNKTFLLHPVFTINSKIFPNSSYFSILERKILRSLK